MMGQKAKGGPVGGPKQMATVRYDDAATAQAAVLQLNGSLINGTPIEVALDHSSKDGTKLKVSNIPSEAAWQEVKDHFKTVGRVAFADVTGSGKGACVGGTVRYFTTDEAQVAIATYNNTEMNGHTIEVRMHSGTKDQTKIQIFGMPPGTEWQEVKDHFGQVGKIAFAETYTGGGTQTGIIRYDDPGHAQIAAKTLNGSLLGGVPIWIELDQMSRDLSRLIVHGIPGGIEWQELKDHFKPIGTVAFSEVKGGGKGGKGAGAAGKTSGMGMGNGMNLEMMQMLAGLSGLMQGTDAKGRGSYAQSKGGNRGSPYSGADRGDANQNVIANLLQAMGMNDPAGSGRVFVRGFDFGTTEKQLRAHMGLAGRILNVHWISPGSAEVIYETSGAAQNALSLDKSTLWGNTRFIDVLLK